MRLIVVLLGHGEGVAKNVVGIADVSGIFDRDRGGSGVSEPVWWERGAKCLFGMLPDTVC
jgi:hypothetical protein